MMLSHRTVEHTADFFAAFEPVGEKFIHFRNFFRFLRQILCTSGRRQQNTSYVISVSHVMLLNLFFVL